MKLYELFVTVLIGVVIPSIKTWHGNNKILKELDSVRSEVNAVKVIGEKNNNGIKTAERYRLFQDLSKAIERGYTTQNDFRELNILYDSYRELGGNGHIEALFERYRKLEIREG